MRIGVPKEVKVHEYRVGLVPGGAEALVADGHQVFVQTGAGEGCGIPDEAYEEVGARVVDTADEVWESAEMIIKVKEPLPSEVSRMRDGQVIFTYFHLAAFPDLARELVERNVTAIAYETIQTKDGRLPLLQPMSEVAGRMAIQVGARSLEKERGGRGVLLGGIPGVLQGKVVILGAGTVGREAAKMAMGLGARVTVLDVNLDALRRMDDLFGNRLQTRYSNPSNVREEILDADLVVGAVLIPGGRAPHLIRERHLHEMMPGSVVVDVSVDQGGCIETCRPTTHDDPTYVLHGVVHYCVANMPGAVPRTSTYGLTNATLSYARALAGLGVAEACQRDSTLVGGLNTHRGWISHARVASDLELPYRDAQSLLA